MEKKVAPVVQPPNDADYEILEEVSEEAFCEGCEFVRILNEDARGWCREHGDLNGGPPDEF